MRNRNLHTTGSGWRSAAVASAIVAISVSAAIAQTTLKFVGPENNVPSTNVSLAPIERMKVATAPEQTAGTELRVLTVTDGKTNLRLSPDSFAPVAANSGEQSQAPEVAATRPVTGGQTQLRFVGDATTAAVTQHSIVSQTPVAAPIPIQPLPSTTERSLIADNEPVRAPAKSLPPITPIIGPQVNSLPEPKPLAAQPVFEARVRSQVSEIRIAEAPRPIASSTIQARPPKPANAGPELTAPPSAPVAMARPGRELFSGLPQIASEPTSPSVVVEPSRDIVLQPSQPSTRSLAKLDAPRNDKRPLIELFVEALPVKAQPQPIKSPLFEAPIAAPKSLKASESIAVKAEPKPAAPAKIVADAPKRVTSAFDDLKPITPMPIPAPKDQWQPADTLATTNRPQLAPQIAANPVVTQIQPAQPAAPPKSEIAKAPAVPSRVAAAPITTKPMPPQSVVAPPTQVAIATPTKTTPVAAPVARPDVAKLQVAQSNPPIITQPAPVMPIARTPIAAETARVVMRQDVPMNAPATPPAQPNAKTIQDAFADGLATGPNFPHTSGTLADAATRGADGATQPAPATLSNNYSFASTANQPTGPKPRFFMATETKPEVAPQPGPEAMVAPAGEPMATGAPVPESLPCNCGDGSCPQMSCPYGPGQSGTRCICGLDCGRNCASCDARWRDEHPIPWSLFGPGEYVGPPRPEHVSTYYLRVNDFLTLTFIESRQKSAERYRIGVGDRLRAEWLPGNTNSDAWLNREVTVQPDGSVTLPMVGEVSAAGKTINEFQDEVVQLYGKYQRDPQITITPLETNIGVQDILKAVIGRNASAGQVQELKVTPEGTIQAAGIGSVYVQGLTLDELRSELEARYAAKFGPGLMISPALTEHATNYVFMGGEVRTPGRYTLEGPTTVMQAISMAGGWNNGGNTREVVIFRRDENWCLKATKVNVRAPLYGKDPCPTNDVWLRDNDLVIVPKERILCATDVIELYFTRGIYAVFPINYVYDFSKNTAITPIP